MDQYSDLSKADLIKKVKELECLVEMFTEKKNQEELLEFPWVGNLGRWCWSVENDNLICNDQKVLALNYTKDEIPEKMGFEFFTSKLHPEDYERVMENMRQHLKGNTDVYEVEYRIQTKDGYWKWYYDRGKITKRNKKNQPSLLVGIVFDITETKEMEMLIKKQNKELAQLANYDHLTEIYNSRGLRQKLESEIKLSHKNKEKLSIILMDIDRFKLVNDIQGHVVGDQVLKQTATNIKKNLLGKDIVGRCGGEEFLIILPNTNKQQAHIVAERIRTNIENDQFPNGIKITVSGGIKEYNGEPIDIFIDGADKCLYRAKNKGRNKIVCD